MSFNWKGRRVAVLGGDRREVEIVRSLVAAGAEVITEIDPTAAMWSLGT